ncbi:Rv0361 family membrane protein [Rhodococcoides fascians]|uniref:DUF4878 domain-containing protein n=1 Tax=Rhodococcoides fascians TaxID=1828 RepID=A0A143QGQ9_RHOFA|nr:hypothetical protein [Rhodococcus fascians]AMY22101.1 hypothetical protein A3Q41_00783 [Rhodococcus fascians]KMJ51487.1 hypothetical protein ACG96_03235 [Rhodococcus fascians]OZC42215.1 hypothetical protein CHX23_06920 [Rhodococcus fascians]
MPDEKNNATPEADTTKIDLNKKKPADESTDAPTEKIAAPAADSTVAAPRKAEPQKIAPQKIAPRKIEPQKARPQQVGPRRVGPPAAEPDKPSHKKWWAALVAAVVVIAAVAAGAYLLIDRTNVEDSPEAQIRTTVESFTRALAAGDLATLRSTSCGDLATFYRDIPDAEFADVHRVSVEQGNIPTVDSIDAIQVTDDTTAIAQVIAHTDANPNDRSPRTFDLSLDGDQWKVCS